RRVFAAVRSTHLIPGSRRCASRVSGGAVHAAPSELEPRLRLLAGVLADGVDELVHEPEARLGRIARRLLVVAGIDHSCDVGDGEPGAYPDAVGMAVDRVPVPHPVDTTTRRARPTESEVPHQRVEAASQ